MRSRTPSRNACRIAGSVGSCGSPIPKSTTSWPASSRADTASLRRTNGYVPCDRSVGESATSRTLVDRTEHEPAKRLVRALECVELDELVSAVGVARRPGTEVHCGNPARREVRDVGPRLLRLDREPADLDEAPDERRIDHDV